MLIINVNRTNFYDSDSWISAVSCQKRKAPAEILNCIISFLQKDRAMKPGLGAQVDYYYDYVGDMMWTSHENQSKRINALESVQKTDIVRRDDGDEME